MPHKPEDTQYWLGPVVEADLVALAHGGVSEFVIAQAKRLLKPLARTDAGQTTFVYGCEAPDLP